MNTLPISLVNDCLAHKQHLLPTSHSRDVIKVVRDIFNEDVIRFGRGLRFRLLWYVFDWVHMCKYRGKQKPLLIVHEGYQEGLKQSTYYNFYLAVAVAGTLPMMVPRASMKFPEMVLTVIFSGRYP